MRDGNKMDKKTIIDIEEIGTSGTIGFIALSENGEQIELLPAGKEIIPVPEFERDNVIYKLLKENCDLHFCTTQTIDDFSFYPVPQFSIFAIDHRGNCFGTIGGAGDIMDDTYPVGYVNDNGTYGVLAGSIKEFLSLANYYPHWWEVVQYEQNRVSHDMDIIEKQKLTNRSQYLKNQHEIGKTLKLSKNLKSIEALILNIKSPLNFKVYSSKAEAQEAYTFLDISDFMI